MVENLAMQQTGPKISERGEKRDGSELGLEKKGEREGKTNLRS